MYTVSKMFSKVSKHISNIIQHFSPTLGVSLNYFPVFSLLSLEADDGAYALLAEMEIKCVLEQLRSKMERAGKCVISSYIQRLERLLSCVKAQCSVCVSLRSMWFVCVYVCVLGRGIRPTKLVYHQLCSRSVPATIQHFFQLSPSNCGSGRLYSTTLGMLLWPDPEH